MNVAAALSLCLGSLAAQQGGTVEALLARRGSESEAKQSLASLRILRADDADLAVGAALLRSEYFFANQFSGEDDRPSLLKRSVEDGLALLSEKTGRRLQAFKDLEELPAFPKDTAEVLFWTTVSYGRLIKDMSVFERPAAAIRFHDMLLAVIELDETVFYGAAHRALALYKAKAPGFLRGDKKAAFQHAARAMQIAPDFAGNAVALAKVALDSGQSREQVPHLLQRGLEATLDDRPQDQPEQARAKKRAKELLQELD